MSALDSFRSFMPPKNLDNTANGKLQGLRYQLALEGCSHSQLSLAKSFLKEAGDISETAKKENSELGMRWLLMASREGNTDAIKLLQNCYTMGIGVTANNRDLVEQCLRSTNEEKVAQRVGCSLFRLMAYDIRETVPLEYFQQRIFLYLKEEDLTEKHTVSVENKYYSDGVFISAEDVVTSVHNCLLGRCPALSLDVIPNFVVEKYAAYLKFNSKFVKNVLNSYVSSLDMLCHKLANVPLHLHVFVFFALVFIFLSIYAVPTDSGKFIILKTAVAYYLFLIIIVTSARMVRSSEAKLNLEKWKKVVRQADKTVTEFVPNFSSLLSIPNFMLFLFAAILFVTTDDLHFPNLKFFGRWLLLWFSFRKVDAGRFNWLANIFFLLSILLVLAGSSHVLDTFPYLSNALFSVNLPFMNTFIIKPVHILFCFTLLVYAVLLCNCHLQSSLRFLATTAWFYIVLDLHDIKTFCFTFVLMSLIVPFTKRLEWYGKILVLLLTAQFTFQSSFLMSFFEITILLLSFIVTDIIISLKNKFEISSVQIYTTLIFFFALLSQTSIMPNFSEFLNIGSSGNITWSKYSNLCHRHTWSETNMAHAQLSCNKYKGWTISLEGNVEKVWLKNSVSNDLPDDQDSMLVRVFNLNLYEVTLHIKGTFRIEAEISVLTDDRCKDFVLDLRGGDLLSIVGIFQDGLGTDKPVIKLLSAECISCMDNVLCDAGKKDLLDIQFTTWPKLITYLFSVN